MTLTDPPGAKRALRVLMRAHRTAGSTSSGQLVARLLDMALPAASAVAGFWPLPGEPELVPAWDALHRRGHVMVLPETTAPGTALRFRLWRPGDVLRPGRYGTLHPDGPELEPDILFVPLLAWDRRLNRLGHGGGYYDRTLASRPDVIAIGAGFAVQEVASVPTGPYDIPLGAMVTERETILGEGWRG